MTLEKAIEIVRLFLQGDDTLDINDIHDALQLCLQGITFLEQLFRIIKQMQPYATWSKLPQQEKGHRVGLPFHELNWPTPPTT